MKKIVLLCALGMSTGMLVQKMNKYAGEVGYTLDISAHSIEEAETVAADADIILLGPQVSYAVGDIQAKFPQIPVEPIDMLAYGMQDGKTIVEHCRKVLGV